MRMFDFETEYKKLLTPTIVDYLSQIHEFKGIQTGMNLQEEMLSEEGIIPEGNEEYFGMTEPDEQWDYSAEVEEPVYSEEEIATEEAAGDPEETYTEENPAIPEGETLAGEPAIPEEVDITEEDSAIPEETFAEEDPVNPEEELFIEEEPVDPEEENLGEENLEYSEETSEEELPRFPRRKNRFPVRRKQGTAWFLSKAQTT